MVATFFKAFLAILFFMFFWILMLLSLSFGGTLTQKQEISPSGYNWQVKEGVSLSGARQTTMSGLQDLADWYKARTSEDLLVTSGTDGNMHQSGERGSHYSGDKLDVASDYLEDPNFRAQFIEYAESKGIIVLDEYDHPSKNSTGGHLDLNFENYKE